MNSEVSNRVKCDLGSHIISGQAICCFLFVYLPQLSKFILLKYIKLPNAMLRELKLTMSDKGYNLTKSKTDRKA